jgi:hypothetical protein
VKALVDPLDEEQRLCRETFKYALEDLGGVEDFFVRCTVCRVELGLRLVFSLSILVGVLALLWLC